MSFFNNIGRSLRSPRPKKPPLAATPVETQQASLGSLNERPLFVCQPFVRTSLVKGSFKTIVVLPKYVDELEWLALNGTLYSKS